ncbi:MAG: hypothetical protein E6Q68_01685 [Polynucleobacter sp.]|nr:MAG: hypothetical protein E6Q68_01685 [Polynucleobacter sp.]
MKKFIFMLIASVALMSIGVLQAQVVQFAKTASNPTGAFVDGGSDTVYLTVNQSFVKAGIQPVATKVSGTLAGTATLQGSIDGVNFVTIGSAFTLTNVAKSTTIWTVDYGPYSRYRVIFTGSGTMSATGSAFFLGRR